jgi:hypothetical protein
VTPPFFSFFHWTLSTALMMEAVQTSETSVNSHQSTRRYNLEDDSHLPSHRRENLKSHKVIHVFFSSPEAVSADSFIPHHIQKCEMKFA